MNNFFFEGKIPASKSLMNRALVVQSYFPELTIVGESQCVDVKDMREAVSSLRKNSDIFCGDAGTVLRFMAFRCAREPGVHKLTGSPRLLQRPQDDLELILRKLQVDTQFKNGLVEISSQGWKNPGKTIKVPRNISSQFASGLLLNAWNLDFELDFEMESGVSEGYWQLTVQLVKSLGMQVQTDGWRWRIPPGQKIRKQSFEIEPDFSSAFAIAAAGALAGVTKITNFFPSSLQPDIHGFEILQNMNADVLMTEKSVTVKKASGLKAINVNLENSPDMFPVLATVCAFADGVSTLRGAPHLVYKESNRIVKTAELLKLAGFRIEILNDGMKIWGQGSKPKLGSFIFNPDRDHRMAMCAGLMMLMGFDVRIEDPQVVAKSFPEFWQIMGLKA